MRYSECLKNHKKLRQRKEDSESKLVAVSRLISERLGKQAAHCNVFCCGSLGRGDFGKNSDLDIFVFSKNREDEQTRTANTKLLYQLISVFFPGFLYQSLSHSKISEKYRQYLVL